MRRRDLIIGAACLGAAGAGAALKPRRDAPLLKDAKLAQVVPAAFGGWTSEDISDPLAVNGEETLASKLYNELLVRNYINLTKGVGLTMLLAYGGRQTDELQLHRPEICYPAFGYTLTRNEPLNIPIGPAVVPARRLAAEAEDRRDSIIYWTRLGEALPQDGGQQREARLKTAMEGIIPDGLLSRFSMAGEYPERNWPTLTAFVAELVTAIRPDMRKVLIGSERARLLDAVRASS